MVEDKIEALYKEMEMNQYLQAQVSKCLKVWLLNKAAIQEKGVSYETLFHEERGYNNRTYIAWKDIPLADSLCGGLCESALQNFMYGMVDEDFRYAASHIICTAMDLDHGFKDFVTRFVRCVGGSIYQNRVADYQVCALALGVDVSDVEMPTE